MRQLQIQSLERSRADQTELRSILSGLQSDRYSKPKTELLLSQAEQYESEDGGSRANRLVLEAAKLHLRNLTRSGKAIDPNRPASNYPDYTSQDHSDASEYYQEKAEQATSEDDKKRFGLHALEHGDRAIN